MISAEFGKVGSKGELYLPKKFREKLGLTPNSRIRYYLSPKGNLVIEKVFTIEELIAAPSIATVSVEEIETLSESMQQKGEQARD